MEGILLHKEKAVTAFLREGLAHENLYTVSRSWPVSGDLAPYIRNSHFVLIDESIDPCSLLTIIEKISMLSEIIPIFILTNHPKEYASSRKITYMEAKSPLHFIAHRIKEKLNKKNLQDRLRWIKAYDLELDLYRREAKRDRRVVHLRNKEFALLEFFIMNRGKVLTRNIIIESVWDHNAQFGSNTLDVHVNRLRKKIELNPSGRLIHTVHCIGYRFEQE